MGCSQMLLERMHCIAYSKNKMKQITRYSKNLQNLLQNTENLFINAGDQHEKRLLQTLVAL